MQSQLSTRSTFAREAVLFYQKTRKLLWASQTANRTACGQMEPWYGVHPATYPATSLPEAPLLPRHSISQRQLPTTATNAWLPQMLAWREFACYTPTGFPPGLEGAAKGTAILQTSRQRELKTRLASDCILQCTMPRKRRNVVLARGEWTVLNRECSSTDQSSASKEPEAFRCDGEEHPNLRSYRHHPITGPRELSVSFISDV